MNIEYRKLVDDYFKLSVVIDKRRFSITYSLDTSVNDAMKDFQEVAEREISKRNSVQGSDAHGETLADDK